MTGAWGISLPFTDGGLAEQAEQYVRLAGAGYTDLWTLEASGWDAFTPLAMVAHRLPETRFGTAIVPVQTRGAATLAGHAAAMAELAPGRFTLGVGASTSAIVQNWNGVPYQEPYRRTRDTVDVLRRVLAGEKVTHEYDTFSVRGLRLDRAPARPPGILVAALRAGMLRLAGSVGDGAVLSWLEVDDVPVLAGQVGPGKTLAARLFVCPSTDRERVLALARRQIAWYANTPVYRAFHEWLGRGDEFGPGWALWDAGDRSGAVDAIPEKLVDRLVISGSPDACREHVRRYLAAGLDLPLLHVLPVGTTAFEAALSLAPGAGR